MPLTWCKKSTQSSVMTVEELSKRLKRCTRICLKIWRVRRKFSIKLTLGSAPLCDNNTKTCSTTSHAEGQGRVAENGKTWCHFKSWLTSGLVRRHGRSSKALWKNSHMSWSHKVKWECSRRDIPSTKDWQPVGTNQWVRVLHQIGLQLWILARKTRSRFPLFDDAHNTIWQILFQSNTIRDKVRV